MKIFDKHGQIQTLAWLYDRFGDVTIHSDEGLAPFRVAELREAADLSCRRSDGASSSPTAAATIGVQVLDVDNEPIPGVDVVFYWPDAPDLKGFGWYEKGVIGQTNSEGFVGFPMGGGAYYDPAITAGPHAVWIPGGPVVSSEMISGLGMIAGTNHTHLNVTFQNQDQVDPYRVVEIRMNRAIRAIKSARKLLRQLPVARQLQATRQLNRAPELPA